MTNHPNRKQDAVIAELKARYAWGICCVLEPDGGFDSHRYGQRRLRWSEILVDGLGRYEVEDLGGDVIGITYPDHEGGVTLHYLMTPRKAAPGDGGR